MTMSGVVIWYARSEFQAIIWCEDCGELGLAGGATAWRNPMAPVKVGDCVAFDVARRGPDRLCRDIRVVEAQAAPGLPAAVKAGPLAQRPAVSPNRLLHLCASRD